MKTQMMKTLDYPTFSMKQDIVDLPTLTQRSQTGRMRKSICPTWRNLEILL
jgi:hypothetical protein